MSVGAFELFGTDEAPAERRTLRAGPLSAILEDGALRTICFGGIEMVRAISYLARDGSWGTYKAELSDMRVSETDGIFEVGYAGVCVGPEGRFSYRITIKGEASGTLVMEAEGTALTDFPTNRTGFVVLHPAEAAGSRLTIRHSDGTLEETTFPKAISPDQPAFDIAALTHEPAPGLVCTVEMEGDAFEMEDQRNWTDASFKTYVRPLSKPRPYVIANGSTDRQKIALHITGKLPASASDHTGPIIATLGDRAGSMPRMALFQDDLSQSAEALPTGLAQYLIVRLDVAQADAASLKAARDLAATGGASIAVELVLDARNPVEEARAAFAVLDRAGIRPSALLVSPRREFRTRPSGILPDGEHPTGALVSALKQAGFSCPTGAGTPSYFTEFNRNPPAGECDFVFFSIAAVVHAADDVSVMETLSVYPNVIASARALCPDKDIWLGPCTIGVRRNPYGAGVVENPERQRGPSAREDPRQSALFGAAFAVGAATQAIASGVRHLTLASPTGTFGLAGPDGQNRPLRAVQAELAAAAGADYVRLSFNRPGVSGVAYRSPNGLRALIANLTAGTVWIALPPGFSSAAMLQPDARWSSATELAGPLKLPPYRTALFFA